MVKLLWGVIKETRPKQWVKNFALFAGLIFSGSLFDPINQIRALQAFLIFCGLSSATYLLNDVFDIERDKAHPFKRKRPVASGLLHPTVAVILALVLIFILLPIAFRLSPAFFLAGILYLTLQLLYSAYLKQVILLDVMAIATGFVLRVYGGVWITDAHLSVWFLLSVISFALFLAIGKRRSELTLMAQHASRHRETLLHYPKNLLDILTSMFANSTWLTYALFAFQQPPIITPSRLITFFGSLDLAFTEVKYFMTTVPLVIYGIMRYLYIIYEKREGESPERVLITDTPLLITVLLWLFMTVGIIYYLGA